MTSDHLPSVLTFPNSKQNSISIVRAITNARALLEQMPNDLPPSLEDQLQAAIDDLTLMLGAVQS